MEERKPNIAALVERKDLFGLLGAASYKSFASDAPGDTDDSGSLVRAEAIAALGTLAPERARRVVRASLYDSADEVRCEAVRVLSALHETEPLAQALKWLPKDEPSYVLALDALAEPGESVPLPAVADALVHREDDEPIGEAAAQLILSLLERDGADVAGVLEVVLPALDDERRIVVDRAAELLVWLAPDSVEALVGELENGSNPAMAAYVLGSIGDPRTLPALVDGLRHAHARVRKESAWALAELQDPAAVKPLLRATRDPDHAVRTQAGMALDGLGSAAVIVGVAALMRPLVEEAVRTALAGPDNGTESSLDRWGAPAQSHSRSQSHSESQHSNGRLPQEPEPPPTQQRPAS